MPMSQADSPMRMNAALKRAVRSARQWGRSPRSPGAPPARAPAGAGGADGEEALACRVAEQRHPHDGPGGREQEDDGEDVADEARGDHQRTGQQDETAVGDLLAGNLAPRQRCLDAPEDSCALAAGEPRADQRHTDEQADGVEDADRVGDRDDDGQLDEGSDEEDDDEQQCHAWWAPVGVGRGRPTVGPAYRRPLPPVGRSLSPPAATPDVM